MTEIELLRKEINELRERIAMLEHRTFPLMQIGGQPQWPQAIPHPLLPPFVVTCEAA